MVLPIPMGWNKEWADQINSYHGPPPYATVSLTDPLEVGNNRTCTLATVSTKLTKVAGCIGRRSDKFYFEVTIGYPSTHGSMAVGVSQEQGWFPGTSDGLVYSLNDNTTCIMYRADGQISGWAGIAAYGDPYVIGDVIGVAVNFTVSPFNVTFYKNNVSQGVAPAPYFSGLTNGLAPIMGLTDTFVADSMTVTINGGDDSAVPFVYAPPAGYAAWNGAPTLDSCTADTLVGWTNDNSCEITSNNGIVQGTWGRKSGKFYFEMQLPSTDTPPTYGGAAGIISRRLAIEADYNPTATVFDADVIYMSASTGLGAVVESFVSAGSVATNPKTTNGLGGQPYVGGILGVACDMDHEIIYWLVDGVPIQDGSGNPMSSAFTPANGEWWPYACTAGGNASVISNFTGPFHDGGYGPTVDGKLFIPWSLVALPVMFQAVFNIPATIPFQESGTSAKPINLTATTDGSETWNWIVNSVLVSYAKSPTLSFPIPGIYTVELSAIRSSDGKTSTWTRTVNVTGKAKPRFAYQNLFKNASSTTTTNEDASHPHTNLWADLEIAYWQPGTSGANNTTAVFGSAVDVTYFAFYGHNLGATGASAKLQYSLDSGSTWVDATSWITPVGTECVYKVFAQIAADHWRVALENCTVDTYLAMASFGVDFELEHGLYDDSFSPPGLAETAEVTNSTSENGAFLGRIGLQTASLVTFSPSWMSEAFAWETWYPFIKYTELRPFWFLWDRWGTFPVAAWGQTDGAMTPVSYANMSFLNTTLTARMKIA